MVIDGLAVQVVEAVQTGGRDGVRIVQVLPTGGEVVLQVVTFGDPRRPMGAPSPARVTPAPGDSAVGTVRYGPFIINARAQMPTDSLAGLLRRLIRVDPTP